MFSQNISTYIDEER